MTTLGLAEAGIAEPLWRTGWANDEFLGSDNQFTNGVFLQKNSALAASLEQTGGTPAFGRSLASWLLPAREGLHCRETWTIAQNMQTPTTSTRPKSSSPTCPMSACWAGPIPSSLSTTTN